MGGGTNPAHNVSSSASMSKTQPIRYKDENGKTVSLFWYSKLPAGGEYRHRSKNQKAMADRLSQIPQAKASHTRAMSASQQIEFRLANEAFNPWSTHQMKLKNYGVTHGLQTRPSRFEPGRMLVGGGLTDIIM